jgi:cytochrome P450
MAELMERVDERGIPIVDPALFPSHTNGEYDWRAVADDVREEHRFFRIDGDPVIWFTRFEDAKALYEDWDLFTSVKDYDFPYLVPLDHDPPESIAWRRAIMSHFSIPYVETWVPRMREYAQELIAGFVDDGEVDFVSRFAQPHFPGIAGEWLGVPKEDRQRLIDWQHGVFHISPDAVVGTGIDMGNNSMLEMRDYLEQLMFVKRQEPDDSFTSFVAHLEVPEPSLTDRERVAILNLMGIGSAHTTSAHLGYVWSYLAGSPETQRMLRERPEDIDTICEEIHRQLPLYGIPRIVTRDAEFAGCELRRGDKVFVLYSQVNRDPRQKGFDHEDLLRKSNQHMSFQRGVHRCIGIHWARIARHVAVEEWHAAIPEYRLKPGAKPVEQFNLGVGYHELPLVW